MKPPRISTTCRSPRFYRIDASWQAMFGRLAVGVDDPDVVASLAAQIKSVVDAGVQSGGVVIGSSSGTAAPN